MAEYEKLREEIEALELDAQEETSNEDGVKAS
jgi:hypothetical protein